MKNSYSLIPVLLIFLGVTNYGYAENIKDPIQSFYSNYEIFKEDELIVFRADLNEDGLDEIFISTTSDRRNNSKAGLLWELYISAGNGYFHYGEKTQLGLSFSAPEFLVRLKTGHLAIVNYHASGAGNGAVSAYYLDDDNVLINEELGDHAEPGEFESKFQDVIQKNGAKDLSKQVKYERIPLSQVYSEEKIDQLKSYKEDFWATHTFADDPDAPNTINQLVFRKSDGKFFSRVGPA